jgi:hypothetical protein
MTIKLLEKNIGLLIRTRYIGGYRAQVLIIIEELFKKDLQQCKVFLFFSTFVIEYILKLFYKT